MCTSVPGVLLLEAGHFVEHLPDRVAELACRDHERVPPRLTGGVLPVHLDCAQDRAVDAVRQPHAALRRVSVALGRQVPRPQHTAQLPQVVAELLPQRSIEYLTLVLNSKKMEH